MEKNWRRLGPVSFDRWHDTIAGAGGPDDLAAQPAYAAAGEHSALCLAMLGEESSFATDFAADPESNLNPLNMRIRDEEPFQAFDSYAACVTEWRDRVTSPTYHYKDTVTLEDLIRVYAPTSENDTDAYIAHVRNRLTEWGVSLDDGNAKQNLRIVLNPGHRNTTGGDAEEVSLTPALAERYFAAFSGAGYETVDLGDTSGDLDAAGKRMAEQLASAPGQAVLFDLHYEGSSAPGCFAIVPDVTGLVAAAPVVQDANDTWENNTLDRKLARAVVERIAAKTGLTLRTGIREDGIMDEDETYVGQGGDGSYPPSRLATFGWTSPHRVKAVRLVIEHGNHTVQPDRDAIFTSDFTERCAQAAVEAVIEVYGAAATAGGTVPTIPWDRDATGIHKLGKVDALAFYGAVTANKDVRVHVTADTKTKTIGTVGAGKTATIRGTFRTTKHRWGLIDLGENGVGRAVLSGFKERWPVP